MSDFDKDDKRPLPIGKNKKVPELGGKIIKEVITLRPKAYTYVDGDGNDHKKAKDTKMCVIKQERMFQNFKYCWSNNKNVHRSQQRFKSYKHDVCKEEVNKTALSANDDKRLQTYDNITVYSYGTNAFKVCENEMLNSKRFII